ncbi:MAG: polyprenyl synthetase family protein [Oscillospiraceae bacterium]|nr:polyprenyl synthetase family protein [Oscillospiraceae bacterium]MDD3832490.1 polyprenyl synthetase family protein [Oscillospiraceae bacterium]MDD4546366.1 polyprenyl synthetase family protein [Oscillospiraceae bacterium]
MSNSIYNDDMKQHFNIIESSLPKFIPLSSSGLQGELFNAMEYSCAAGGKRLRPVLLMEFCRVCGGDTKKALPFACAVEMIHSYSLVHDDLPCMDDSPLRRGRPSTHAAFGETMALLAGDALLNRAFEVMLDPANRQGLSTESAIEAAFILAKASGAGGMVGGQVIDLKSECKAIDIYTLEQLQEGKTAALISAACRMGCCIAGADDKKINAAGEFGLQLGLCFQVVDDILDETATAEQLGKPSGSDSQNCKATYVSVLGLKEAESFALSRTKQAILALEVFGNQADGLRDLTNELLRRNK